MKKLSSFICFCLISMSIFAQKGPKIKFKSTVIDYGNIDYGSGGVRAFEFTNIGDAPLVIETVDSSCGCTIPSKPMDSIAPGETGYINIVYDTKKSWYIRETITVISNAVNVKDDVSILKIKGNVNKPKDYKYKSWKKSQATLSFR